MLLVCGLGLLGPTGTSPVQTGFSPPTPPPSPSPSLRLALAGAWWALRGRGLEGRGRGGRGLEGRGWGRVLALLEAVGGGAPALLRPRHRARLSLGLRAQVVTSLLRELGPAPAVLDALDWLFPEGAGPAGGHALGPPQELPLVGVAEEHFREQVLGILGSGRGLEPFLQEYGPCFRRSLFRLFLEFLGRVESALPPPDLPQLERLCRSHAPPGSRPRPLSRLQRYFAEVRHAHPAPLPRPLPAEKTPLTRKPRPCRRRLRPLRMAPLGEFPSLAWSEPFSQRGEAWAANELLRVDFGSQSQRDAVGERYDA
uniref:TERF1-interacting nuclear factor 2 N-terminal domain-containing protein n=1 Tax=Taeniopygia guttata TaxID=59729 RepID=A0A674H355_TAEGU